MDEAPTYRTESFRVAVYISNEITGLTVSHSALFVGRVPCNFCLTILRQFLWCRWRSEYFSKYYNPFKSLSYEVWGSDIFIKKRWSQNNQVYHTTFIFLLYVSNSKIDTTMCEKYFNFQSAIAIHALPTPNQKLQWKEKFLLWLKNCGRLIYFFPW